MRVGRSASRPFSQHPRLPSAALGKGGLCPTVGQPGEPFLVRFQASAAQTHTPVQVRPRDTTCLPPRSLPDPVPKVPAEGALATLSLRVQDGGSWAAPEGRGKVR